MSNIERTDSQQTTCAVTAIIDGVRQQVASATSTIRPDRGMTRNVDFNIAHERLDEETLAEIAQTFGAYVLDELRKAAALGIPINL